MPLPYTDSPLGSFLATLGQGLPALAQAHRARQLQDEAIALQQQEAQSRMTTEGLQQKTMQEQLANLPVQRAREAFSFDSKVDPVTAIRNKANLKALGIDLPDNYVPQGISNEVQQQQNEGLAGKLRGTVLHQLLGDNYPAPPTAGQSPAGPQAPPADPTAAPSAAPSTAMGGKISLTPQEVARYGMTGQFPAQTAQEVADLETARETGKLRATQMNGQLPEADAKFVQTALPYFTQLKDLSRLIKDPRVQQGGWAKMQEERLKYEHGIGNSAPYDQIIPNADLGKQPVTSELANGSRSLQVREMVGKHLASSDQSPAGMQQRIDNIVKYYPYLVYSRYATRGVAVPDQVAQGLGFPSGSDLIEYGKLMDTGKGSLFNVDPARIVKYATDHGISVAKAAALANAGQ